MQQLKECKNFVEQECRSCDQIPPRQFWWIICKKVILQREEITQYNRLPMDNKKQLEQVDNS